MNFEFTEEQQAVRELARQIIENRCGDDTLVTPPADGFDRELWSELAQANLLGVALPESLGGSGFGVLELSLVLQEAGRFLAPVPLAPALALAAPALHYFGTDAQRERLLPALAKGDLILSAALDELGHARLSLPSTRAVSDGSAWRLEGIKQAVPAAGLADRIVVPARTGDETMGVFLVDPRAADVHLEAQKDIPGHALHRMELSGAQVDADEVVGDPENGHAVARCIERWGLVAYSSLQLGLVEEALRRTAEYTSSRKQFGRPIGTFQGVALRAADAYIAVEAMRSTLWQAAWRLAEGLDADREIATAKWWACRGGHEVVHTTQHLHGGIGSDVEYPIHRFFLCAKQNDLALGGASAQLARLGDLLAHG